MSYYSKDEINKAKEMDLLTYLMNFDPSELVKEKYGNYHTLTHDSLKISNGMWYWFSRGIGGKSALDYLITVKEMSFLEAVEHILGYSNQEFKPYYVEPKLNSTKFCIPEKNLNNDRVISYLINRGIDKELIYECINKELIFEDKRHNAVFIGYDKNIPKYGTIRGTSKERYMKEVYGSDKTYSFRIVNNNNSKTIHLFESPIDLLSYITILKSNNIKWSEHNYLSLGGVFQPSKDGTSKVPIALANYLNNNETNKIVLHLDNDNAGRLASKSIINNLKDKYEIIDSPPRIGKDINDFLLLNNQNKNIERRNNNDREK